MACLVFAVGISREPQSQPLDRTAVFQVFLDEFGNVLYLYARVPDALRVDDQGGAHRARTQASGTGHGRIRSEFVIRAYRLCYRLRDFDASFALTTAHRVSGRALIDADENMSFDVFHGFPLFK